MFFFKKKISGWVKSDTCWVVKEPRGDSPIMGIILQKAAVTVEKAGKGWVKIIFAPVRSLEKGSHGKLVSGEGLFIKRNCVAKKPPFKWIKRAGEEK
jgi:hypothetical protein